MIADNWADQTDGTLDNPLLRTELNGPPPVGNTICAGGGHPTVWAATIANGTLVNNGACNNFTSANGPGLWGEASFVNQWWSQWWSQW